MNINFIVQQNFMKSNLMKLVNKDTDGKAEKSTFEEQLNQFREDNQFKKLTNPPQEDAKEPAAGGPRQVICSAQLFSAWDSDITTAEALKKLDENLSQIGEYSLKSNMNPDEVLEHIAAQYTVYKRHLDKKSGSAELEQLDKLIERHTQQYAKGFSEAVGSFYEENGLKGERERIYNSIVDGVASWTRTYKNYIAKHGNQYDTLFEDAKLNQKSLSNELRKAVRNSGIGETSHYVDHYTGSMLAKAAKLARFATSSFKVGEVQILNEEELGIQLGKAVLEARSFLKKTGGTAGHQAAFLQSLQKQLDQHLDKVDSLLKEKDELYKLLNPNTNDSPFTPLDRESVFAVVNVMVEEFEKTGSISSAMNVGKAYGLKAYLSKADVESKTERYRDSHFWGDIIKKALEPETEGARQYQWIRDLMESKTNTWLNLLA